MLRCWSQAWFDKFLTPNSPFRGRQADALGSEMYSERGADPYHIPTANHKASTAATFMTVDT